MDDIEDTNYKFNSQDIENIWYIFFCLADSTFSSVDVSYGKKGPYMLSGETMMSIGKTLETIDFCCYRDAYSDAYTLLRKCRDDLMQYLFVLNVIQNKHGLTDEEAEKFTINSESMMKMIELDVSILVSGERKTDAELAMEKWIYNVLESSENKEDIKQMLAGADLVFITAGMGGGTGTGAAPIVAEIAKEMGILTVGIVTKPFLFEGKARSLRASKGIERLKSNVDDLIVVLNDNLLKITDSKITLDNAFSLADNILEQGITSITDLLTSVGEVNIDFADIKTTMNYRGKAYMGIGRASGEKKVEEAVRQAIENPLTESKIDGAKGVIFNVKGNSDLGLMEINSAVGLINEKVSEDANIIFGTVIDEDMGEDVQVTVIATGVEEKVETEVKQ